MCWILRGFHQYKDHFLQQFLTNFDETKMKLKLDRHKKIEAKNLAKTPQFRFLNLVLPNSQEKKDTQLLTH